MHESSSSMISTWQEAQRNAAACMEAWGMRRVSLSAAGADGGIDVHSYDGYAQVKWRAGTTGRPEIQALVGAGAGRKGQAIFFTGSAYSRAAEEYAGQQGVALFKYDYMGRVTAVNSCAQTFLRRMAEEAAQTFGVEEELRREVERDLSARMERYLDMWDFDKAWNKSGGPMASALATLSFLPLLGLAIYGLVARPALEFSPFWIVTILCSILWYSLANRASHLRGRAMREEYWGDSAINMAQLNGTLHQLDSFGLAARRLAKLKRDADKSPASSRFFKEIYSYEVEAQVSKRFYQVLEERKAMDSNTLQ